VAAKLVKKACNYPQNQLLQKYILRFHLVARMILPNFMANFSASKFVIMPHTESQLIKRLMENMNERAKELRCLYNVDDVIKGNGNPEVVFKRILEVIPAGWQHTTFCEARILYLGNIYATLDFRETPWMMTSDIVVDNRVCGRLDVAYIQSIQENFRASFLPEEKQLINAITDRIGNYLFYRRMQQVLGDASEVKPDDSEIQEVTVDEPDFHWRWRRKMMEQLACELKGEQLGVKALYLIGSTREQMAGPGSDIDLIVHFEGSMQQHDLVKAEIDGWSKCLAFINQEKTGYHSEKLIDLHFVTDADIRKKLRMLL
jgi:hypothetical protein